MSKNTRHQDGIWNGIFTRVFLTNVLLFLGMQMVNTLVARYANTLGASATTVGLVSSLFALTALLLKIVSGPAIDAFSRRNILMGAIFIISVSFFGFSLSDNVEMLFAFRLLQGCGQAFTATCCLALAADSLPADKFGVGIGTFTLAQAACQAIGPSVGLALSDLCGYKITFAIAGGCTMLGVVVAFTIREPEREKKKFRLVPGNIVAVNAILPAVLLFLLQMTFCNINAFLVIYAEGKGVSGIGLFFTAYAVAMLFAPRTVGKLADRLGTIKAVIPAVFLFALAFWMISCADSLPVFLAAAVVAAFGYGASQPAVQTLCMKSVSASNRGAASSTSYIGQDLGNLVGPVIAGMIVERMGYVSMWRFMTIPVLMTACILVLFRRRINLIEKDFRSQED